MKKNLLLHLLLMSLMLCCSAEWWPLWAQAPTYDQRTLTVSGTVRSRKNKEKLENVIVTVKGTSIGTVTNADGYFSLKIPRDLAYPELEFSHLGYVNTRISTTAPDNSPTLTSVIWMTPAVHQLNEVVVYGGDARRIVEEALKKIPDNYPHTESMTNAFYRETIQKRHRYIGVSEAMMEVYKTPYNFRRYIGRDKVHLTKARRLVTQKQSDTLAVKVMGGPNLAVQMDIAKNEDALLEPNTLGYYDFRLEPSVLIDDRLQYVVSFRPRVRVEYALMEGVLYIDRERLSFTRAEFSLDLSDREKAVRDILRKKPAGLRFRPLEVSFLVAYRQQGGKTRLHYVSNVMRFKCDWKRRLFAATYTARSEMVAVEHEEHVERIPDRRQAFRPQQIFYDVVSEYWNAEYWKDYNIIEPTESLEEAVRKLRKR